MGEKRAWKARMVRKATEVAQAIPLIGMWALQFSILQYIDPADVHRAHN